MIRIHGYCFWKFLYDLFKGLRFLKGFLNAVLQFPSHLEENLEKKHTHQAVFLWKIKGKVLKLFVFAIQF